MTSIDLFLLIPVAFAVIRGYRKGIILEAFSFFALVIALIASIKLTSRVMLLVSGHLHGAIFVPFIGYAIVFIGVYLLVTMLGNAFDKAINFIMLGPVNKLAGSVFCLIKVVFMISLFFWLGDRVSLLSGETRQQSFFYSHFHGFAPYVINKVSPALPYMHHALAGVENFFDKIKV
jgi:membrane protein required for colicin V production